MKIKETIERDCCLHQCDEANGITRQHLDRSWQGGMMRKLSLWFRIGRWFDSMLDRLIGGHISIGNLTIYGRNAMHFAWNYRVKRGRYYICLCPPVYCLGRWWPWYLYLSRNGTPQRAHFIAGYNAPGMGEDKRRAKRRGQLLKALAN